ncbi:spore germination protein [Paenibacillus tyrfis]|uniref:spore germination protein n=1 Tax=Paenibacillus tyrfis TaxID=1501230 RepID=UPI000AC022E9|nr:spore germination protein [Paenibacillus tyrfis]
MLLLTFLSLLRKSKRPKSEPAPAPAPSPPSQPSGRLSSRLEDNLDVLRRVFGNSSDVIFREFTLGASGETKAAVAYTECIANSEIVQRLLENLMIQAREVGMSDAAASQPSGMERLLQFTVTVASARIETELAALTGNMLSGHTIVLLDGEASALTVDTRETEGRTVSESNVQTVVRGPRDSFTELIRMNTTLVRRRIKDTRLRVENVQLGCVTRTDVALMYIDGIVNESVVEEVRRRLKRIEIDGILESGNIEEFIQDETFTPFPTMYNTERPDVVAAGLLEGRVAILVDGTPVALLVPVVFTQFFQSAEDYYNRSDFGFLRMLRFASLLISTFSPALYIAITTYHQEMLPTVLLVSLAAQREGVPFPAFVEAFLMEATFEILREAGVRMPRAVGSAISIVGALVLGQAAVEAGFVSAAMVIVVSITAITSFIFPSFSISIPVRILRFLMMAGASVFGLYGIFVLMVLIALHMCSLRSFGAPYMSPIAPYSQKEQQDTFFRFPLWMQRSRPRFLRPSDKIRGRKSDTSPK